MAAVKLQDEFYIGPTPGIDGLIGIAYDKKVLMIAGQDIRQGILVLVE